MQRKEKRTKNSLKNERRKILRKEKQKQAMNKVCEKCGLPYTGLYAELFFKQEGTKKRKRVRGVSICDACLDELLKNPDISANRTHKQ